VITQLACVKSLIVRPSSAVERYRAETTEPRAVGRELQVDTILSGSYLRAGDLFRVNVQLVDVAANEVLWQERIDLKFDNVIALQDRICEQLVSGLQLNLSTGEQEALRQDHAPHPMAYECYLRGLACAETGAGHRQAVELLEGAVSLDPDYAPAWAALCGRYLKARFYLTDESLPAKAEAAIRKALELSPRLPAALFCLLIFHSQNQDLPNALKVCRRLLEVAPNSEYAYEAMGCAYEYAGLPDLALTLLEKANEINPTALPHVIGVLHIQKGDLAAARRSLGRHAPGHPESAYWLALVDYLERKPGEAAARLDELIARDRTGQMSEVAAALRGAIRGDAEESRRLLRRVTERELSAGGHSDYVLGQIYAIIGDTPECLARLRAAIKGGYANYPYLMSDPLYAPARAAAGFGEIAAEMQQARARLISNLILES
jgi:serine/threonine-protein kinase